jgi:hypothetical protein
MFQLRAPKFKLSESDIGKACNDLLRCRGYYVARQQSGLFKTPDNRPVRIGTPGMADYSVLHPYYPAFWLETKAPGKRATEQQQRWAWEMKNLWHLDVCTADRADHMLNWLDWRERSFLPAALYDIWRKPGSLTGRIDAAIAWLSELRAKAG